MTKDRHVALMAERLSTRCYTCAFWDRPPADKGPVPDNRYYRSCRKFVVSQNGTLGMNGELNGLLVRQLTTPCDFGCPEHKARG